MAYPIGSPARPRAFFELVAQVWPVFFEEGCAAAEARCGPIVIELIAHLARVQLLCAVQLFEQTVSHDISAEIEHLIGMPRSIASYVSSELSTCDDELAR